MKVSRSSNIRVTSTKYEDMIIGRREAGPESRSLIFENAPPLASLSELLGWGLRPMISRVWEVAEPVMPR